jgi:hypothetical protein
MRSRRIQGCSRAIRTSGNGLGCGKLASVGATLCYFVLLGAHCPRRRLSGDIAEDPKFGSFCRRQCNPLCWRSWLSMRVQIMRGLFGTAFLLISTSCFAADFIPPGDTSETPPEYGGPVYGAPAYGGPVYGGPVYAAPAYGGPVYGAPIYVAPAYGPVYGGPPYGGPVYHGPVYPRPVYSGPAYGAPIYRAPVYRAPVYGGPIYGALPP